MNLKHKILNDVDKLKIGILPMKKCSVIFMLIFFFTNSIQSQLIDFFTYPPTGSITNQNIKELSGIVPSMNQEGYWGHNDNGNDPIVYRFNEQGEILQSVSIQGENIDWEAMTTDYAGRLFIADTGDNNRLRSTYQIYQFNEPNPEVLQINPTMFQFEYQNRKSNDCEAVFYMNEKLYLITKAKESDNTTLYSLILDETKGRLTANPMGTFLVSMENPLLNIITDASYSPGMNQLAVLTYAGIMFYTLPDSSSLLTPPVHYHPAIFGQSEAICYDGESLMVTNEFGHLWKQKVSFYFPNLSILRWMLH